MGLTLIECAAGLVLAALTLRDVFETVVVSGGTRGLLRIPRRDAFHPRIDNFGQALYLAGGAMVTTGLGMVEPATGPARMVTVGAGMCGLAVMTLAVTYLLEVQSNMAHRDTGVLKMTAVAGQPPSALALMERYARLGCAGELVEILRTGREWSAVVLQSHASHPSLIYFRSAGTHAGWPSTLGTLIDLALILEHLVAQPAATGAAVLAREQGGRLAKDLAVLLALQPEPPPADDAQVQALCGRLVAAGYALRPAAERARFLPARAREGACAEALSRHLGTPGAPLL